MSLVVNYDVIGARIEAPGYTLQDPFSGQPGNTFTYTNAKFLPDGKSIALLPVQLTSAWGAASGKYTTSSYNLDGTNWQNTAGSNANDTWLLSRGVVTGQCTTQDLWDINQAGFLQFQAFLPKNTYLANLMQLKFGQWFTLQINSDGTATIDGGRRRQRRSDHF